MTDDQFLNETWIRAFKDQIDGYPLGHPGRNPNFKPIVPRIMDKDGKVDRQNTLALPCFHLFTDEDRKILTNTDPDWRKGLE